MHIKGNYTEFDLGSSATKEIACKSCGKSSLVLLTGKISDQYCSDKCEQREQFEYPSSCGTCRNCYSADRAIKGIIENDWQILIEGERDE